MPRETLTVPVFGMTCDNCVQAVYHAINSLVGVIDSEVNLIQNQAVVNYDTELLDKAEIIEAIEDAGFETSQTYDHKATD